MLVFNLNLTIFPIFIFLSSRDNSIQIGTSYIRSQIIHLFVVDFENDKNAETYVVLINDDLIETFRLLTKIPNETLF